MSNGFGVLQEYLIMHNILVYDIPLSGVDCVLMSSICYLVL
jgi:hypothetical protein